MPILTGQVGGFAQGGGGQFGGATPAASRTWGPDQEAIARTEADAAKYPATLKQQRFNSMFPYLTNALKGFGAGGPFSAGGSQVGTQPQISAGPVFDPQQIQQQVNAQHAQTSAATEATQRQQAQAAAGHGFGANSPLVAALQGQAANQGMATGAQQEQQFRLGAAQANAGQLLKGQTAQEQQFASRQTEDIERRKPVIGLYGNLISALAGMA